ncbi:MAG: hypothetical protein F4060_09820 [Holophagales bacterium]|nr:hypothetical protein [Holophagales bacterium]MYG32165.1 hypothetical protein [Holophagales bacterium]MYI80226.1 hypothetical protein [Holophagales bacterium]
MAERRTPPALPGLGASLRRNLPFFAIELVVVFVGVYLAFLLGNRQAAEREQDVALKYREVLICDFEILVSFLHDQLEDMRPHRQVVQQIEEGLEPDIPLGEFYYLYDDRVLQAAFDSQNFESLDSILVQAVVRGRVLLLSLGQYVDRLNVFMTTILAPMERDGDRRYYDDDGNLLPHLEAYPRLVGAITDVNVGLQRILRGEALFSLHIETMGIDLRDLMGFDANDPGTPEALKEAVARAVELAQFDLENPCSRSFAALQEP